MDLKDKVVVITGGGGGIGEAMARRFHCEGARAVVVSDIDKAAALRVADDLGSFGMRVDVSDEAQIIALVEECQRRYGQIDLYCSNAGILLLDNCITSSTTNQNWQKIWEVNVMSHVYAARAVLPAMTARGEGYFLITASAAGLLSQIGSTPYSTTKHAAVGFAESLAIHHGDEGIKVSILCPQAVRTAMTDGAGGPGVAGLDGMMDADDLAEVVVTSLGEESFLILPHPEVLTYYQRKASDYDRWLGGMRRLKGKFA